jgi:hypothetical protein
MTYPIIKKIQNHCTITLQSGVYIHIRKYPPPPERIVNTNWGEIRYENGGEEKA